MSETYPTSRSVLVVEDDVEVSQSVGQMLQHLGYAPILCNDAQQAYELIQSRAFELLLIDYRMPEMTGLDLIVMLRGEGCQVPAVMMSGYAATEDRVSPQSHGVSAILKKPVTIEQLETALQSALGPRAASQGQV